MKTKLSEYNKGLSEFIDNVKDKPSDVLLELYARLGRELLTDFTFPLLIPVAHYIAAMYRSANERVLKSRELELVIYDMHQKGYSKHEMLIIGQIASSNTPMMQVCCKLFDKLTLVMHDIVKERGDVVFLAASGISYVHSKASKSYQEFPDNNITNN